MGNFCPHAAALPKSVREYEYIVYSCTIGDDQGARSTCGKLAIREKNECDGKTTKLVVAKKRAGND
jgi:hypothetical protein